LFLALLALLLLSLRRDAPPAFPSASAVNETPHVPATIRRYVSTNVKSKAAIRWLLHVVAHTTDRPIRNQAALALGDLHVQAAVPVIVQLLSTDATSPHRGSLLFVLSSLDYRNHLGALASQLGSQEAEVLELVLHLVEQLPRRLKARQTKEAIRQLEQMVTTPSNTPYVQQALRLLKDVTYPKLA
jgi:HEAT repeat protein